MKDTQKLDKSQKTIQHKRQFQGEVVSSASDKTIVVAVRRVKMHSKYRKQYAVLKKYPVHDDKKAASVGDAVVFEECRPISKTKKWRLINVITKKS